MDPNIRNFKDFLQLYNRITELCFSRCVDNFFNRDLAIEESSCVDKCVQKFTRVNQRVMGVYVEVQTAINTRRMTELEAQAQEATIKAQSEEIPSTQLPETTPLTSIEVENAR